MDMYVSETVKRQKIPEIVNSYSNIKLHKHSHNLFLPKM